MYSRQGNINSHLSFLVLALFLGATAVLAQESPLPAAKAFEYNTSPGSVIVEYFEDIAEIAGEDLEARVRIWGDGRAVVHFPVYMKQAGDYETQLTTGELDTLLHSLVDKGLLDLDESALRAAKRDAQNRRAQDARNGRGTVKSRADGVTTIVRVNLTAYTPAGETERAFNVSKTLVWHGLKGDAEDYPEIAELADAMAAVAQIEAVCRRPDLRRVEPDK